PLQALLQTVQVLLVNLDLSLHELHLLSPVTLSLNEFVNLPETISIVVRREVRLDPAGLHQVNPGEVHSVGVEQMLHGWLRLMQPLSSPSSKALIVANHRTSDASPP